MGVFGENIIEERGSLVLDHDSENHRFYVGFADWYDHQGFGSLDAVSDWFEICNGHGRMIKLNGSQAQTVRAWANQYL